MAPLVPSEIYGYNLSESGSLISTSRDPKDEHFENIYYPTLAEIGDTETQIETVLRTDLVEADRLGPNVDLDFYVPGNGYQERRVVFKYFTASQSFEKRWPELNIWIRLPRDHPNIVPFERVVLDEVEHRVVGFTRPFVRGLTLDENDRLLFKLS